MEDINFHNYLISSLSPVSFQGGQFVTGVDLTEQ